MGLRALKNGRLVFGAADPAIGLFDANGRKLWALAPFIPDHRDNQEKFLISQDSDRIQFSFKVLDAQGGWNQRPAQLDVSQRQFTLPVTEAKTKKLKLSPPRATAPGLKITDWEDSTEPHLNGQTLSLDRYEAARSVAIAPDNQHFLLGTDWSLRVFDRQGQQQWQAPVLGTAWAVNISGVASRGLSEQTAITRLFHATGRAVLAASSDNQLALEGYQGHGFFTSALLAGLHGDADKVKDGAVEVLELAKFVQDEVPKISQERQFPVFESQGLIDFPIGLAASK